MNLEIYYYNLTIRLIALIILSFILNAFYLRLLNHSENKSFIRQVKSLYFLQIAFWILFLTNIFDLLLPNNIFGSFFFELILITIIFCTFTFILWKLFNKQKFYFGLFFFSLPLIMLFIFALGMV